MRIFLVLLVMLATSPAKAELREFCAGRPGLGSPACIIDPGHAMIEVGLADWTLDRVPEGRNDTVLAGDVFVRLGLDATTEAQIGWTAYGHVRMRDYNTESISAVARTGDVSLGVKKSLSGPDSHVAIQAFVTMPAGRTPVGAGDWGAGMLLPFDFDLGGHVQLALTPEVDAAVDQDGSGRHIAFGNVIGLSAPISKALIATAEIAVTRDNDPSGHTTETLASASLAFQPGKNAQLDVGAVAGLNDESPDFELYFGISRRF